MLIKPTATKASNFKLNLFGDSTAPVTATPGETNTMFLTPFCGAVDMSYTQEMLSLRSKQKGALQPPCECAVHRLYDGNALPLLLTSPAQVRVLA